MPGRIIPFINDQIYHVFNRGIDHRPTFIRNSDYRRAFDTLNYYQYKDPLMRLSYLFKAPKDRKTAILDDLGRHQKLVSFLSYCLMPNHFHFLIKQECDCGISKFMSNFQNSFTKYFNMRQQRNGPLFLNQFKAVRIETEEQFCHVSRYIHLNPYSSFVIKNLEELINYPWSSFREYAGNSEMGACDKTLIMSFFKDREGYKKFVLDQADYQRELESIKHLLVEYNFLGEKAITPPR